MERVKFTYKMQIFFDSPIWSHYFSLKCFPKSNSRQTIEQLTFKLSDTSYTSIDTDSFGNTFLNGSIMDKHTSFDAEITGFAWTGVDIFEEYEKPFEADLFLVHSKFTKPESALKEYYNNSFKFSIDETNYDKAIKLMNSIYSDMKYVPASTNINTTAEQALSLGEGVCQDYAHIMIALCRLAGIPARYVVGMLEGEGESHAWTEILSNGIWYGLDPTNNLLVNKSYIKISHGRDYSDCIVSRGVFYGSANQTQKIKVILEPN